MNIITLVLFVSGIGLLVLGAELLVRGASRLALIAGISPLVVGLTVVAYGTSAPELMVSIQATAAGNADIAIGNVVGSNIANVLLILGLSAVITPLVVAQQLIRLDVPLMIGLSILVFLMGLDGQIGRVDGLILFIGAIAYTVFAIRQSRKETQAIRQEYEREFGDGEKKDFKHIALQLAFIIGGLVLLGLGANWLIDGAVAIATLLGVSQLIIGITVVAVGTSLPEVATSVIASIHGERDIAVGNIIGSNIFNILTVLGLSGVVSSTGVTISISALSFDIPVMIVVAVACLPIFFTGHLIARWEGLLFLGYYVVYIFCLFINATHHQSLALFSTVILVYLVPLTIITLLVSLFRSLQIQNRSLDMQQN